MYNRVKFKQRVAHVHDPRAKATHYVGHLLHEKSFWGILAILILIAGLFTLIALSGNGITMKDFSVPYGPYY